MYSRSDDGAGTLSMRGMGQIQRSLLTGDAHNMGAQVRVQVTAIMVYVNGLFLVQHNNLLFL